MDELLRNILVSPLVIRSATALLALLVVGVAVRGLNRLLSRTIADADARYRARKVVTFVGYLLAILLVAAIASGNLPAFGITMGVVGAAVAFSLQEVITSVAGWVAIGFGKLFKVGDRVEFAGVRGDVIDIGIIRSTLMECGEWVAGDLYDGRIVRIANSFVFKEPVYNYSADFPFLWDEIKIPIRGDSDHRLARDVVQHVVSDVVGEYTTFAKQSWADMVRKYRIEDAQVDPRITLSFDENWITFTARYVVDYRKRRTTKDAIFTRLLDDIAATGGRVRVAIAAYEIERARVEITDRRDAPPQ